MVRLSLLGHGAIESREGASIASCQLDLEMSTLELGCRICAPSINAHRGSRVHTECKLDAPCPYKSTSLGSLEVDWTTVVEAYVALCSLIIHR